MPFCSKKQHNFYHNEQMNNLDGMINKIRTQIYCSFWLILRDNWSRIQRLACLYYNEILILQMKYAEGESMV